MSYEGSTESPAAAHIYSAVPRVYSFKGGHKLLGIYHKSWLHAHVRTPKSEAEDSLDGSLVAASLPKTNCEGGTTSLVGKQWKRSLSSSLLLKGTLGPPIREIHGAPINGIMHWLCILWPPKKCLKMFNLIKIGALWAWQNLWGYGSMILTKFWPLGSPWDPSYEHFRSHVVWESANPY